MKNNNGFTLIELLIVIVLLGIIVSIAVPNLLAARRSANTSAAVQAMRVFHSTQSTYQASVGAGNFGTAQELLDQNLIDTSLAEASTSSGKAKLGYKFTISTVVSSDSTLASFNVTANVSVSRGVAKSGDRNFYVDQTGVIRVSANTSVNASSTDPPFEN